MSCLRASLAAQVLFGCSVVVIFWGVYFISNGEHGGARGHKYEPIVDKSEPSEDFEHADHGAMVDGGAMVVPGGITHDGVSKLDDEGPTSILFKRYGVHLTLSTFGVYQAQWMHENGDSPPRETLLATPAALRRLVACLASWFGSVTGRLSRTLSLPALRPFLALRSSAVPAGLSDVYKKAKLPLKSPEKVRSGKETKSKQAHQNPAAAKGALPRKTAVAVPVPVASPRWAPGADT